MTALRQRAAFDGLFSRQIAEELYNEGLISYPRTETDKFAKLSDEEMHALISMQVEDPQWGAYAQRLVQGAYVRPRNGSHDDQAHPPIHPTKYSPNLQDRKKALYELICRHFLACCSDDAIGSETAVRIAIGVEQFECKGLIIEQRNYLEVYKYENWNDRNIPKFTEGEEFVPSAVMMLQGVTAAPPPLSEADLIGLMDRNGIGAYSPVSPLL